MADVVEQTLRRTRKSAPQGGAPEAQKSLEERFEAVSKASRALLKRREVDWERLRAFVIKK